MTTNPAQQQEVEALEADARESCEEIAVELGLVPEPNEGLADFLARIRAEIDEQRLTAMSRFDELEEELSLFDDGADDSDDEPDAQPNP